MHFLQLAMYSCQHSLLIKGDGVIRDESTRHFCGYVIFF